MRDSARFFQGFLACVLAIAALPAGAAPESSSARKPARIAVSVAPEAVSPGGKAEITLTLTPASGIKINRYPKIKFNVAPQKGVAAGAETTLGNDSPPPVDKMEQNYFDRVDPLTLTVQLDADAPSGSHELEGQLVYYYCVAKSGYCAPSRQPIKIALNVR